MDRIACDCESCKNACKHKPGWFLPGEAEKAATAKGMSLKQYFEKYLAVDYYYMDDGADVIFVLSPKTSTMEGGELFPLHPLGVCTFLDITGYCTIHTVAPHECQMYIHTDDGPTVDNRHLAVAMAWKDHQDQITQLLGYQPVLPTPSILDIFSFFK